MEFINYDFNASQNSITQSQQKYDLSQLERSQNTSNYNSQAQDLNESNSNTQKLYQSKSSLSSLNIQQFKNKMKKNNESINQEYDNTNQQNFLQIYIQPDQTKDYLNIPTQDPFPEPIFSKSNNLKDISRIVHQAKTQRSVKTTNYQIQSQISKTTEPNNIKNVIEQKQNLINLEKIYQMIRQKEGHYFDQNRKILRKTQPGFQLLKEFYSLGKKFVNYIQSIYSVDIKIPELQQNEFYNQDNYKNLIQKKLDVEIQVLTLNNVLDI